MFCKIMHELETEHHPVPPGSIYSMRDISPLYKNIRTYLEEHQNDNVINMLCKHTRSILYNKKEKSLVYHTRKFGRAQHRQFCPSTLLW